MVAKKQRGAELAQRVDEQYKLEDLINMDELRGILDDFYNIAPFATAILNLKGEVLLESHWEPICTQYHRVNPKTSTICTESDTHFFGKLIEDNEKYILYSCGNGLYDAASPIKIAGQHLGNFFIGQFLLEAPDDDFFRKQAQRYGFPQKEYLEALAKVQIIPEKGLINRLNFLCSFAGLLGNIGLKEFHRERAEEALRGNEEKYRTILSSIEDGYFEVNQRGDITYFNEAFSEITGYPTDELMGLKNDKYLDQENREKVFKKFNEVWKTGIPTKLFEYELIRKNGEKRTVQTSASLVADGNGQKIGFRGIVRDVSDRKRMEKALRESEEKLARSNKMEALGLLAGGVAHDLNNVLSGIVSYPELILMDLPEDHKLRKPIETMQESGHRAAAIVEDLLTVARGVATTKEPLDLNDLVGDYLNSPELNKLEQFHPTVTVKTHLDTDLLNISGSHVHIRKVVMNLVSNASEAIKDSGNVIISTMNRYVDRPLMGYDDVNIGEYAVLSVSDDGFGISSVDLERIFEPFYTKKVMGRSGTGLGLAVVWNVMQDHKGYINVTSDERGSTFEMYFPITRDEISDKDLSIPIEDFKGNGENILVVDDVENLRKISCNMLDMLGYKTKTVSSGEEAVEYLKEHSVDLILLDMIMDPGINGRETYERIIKIHPNQKAVIISGFAESDEVKEAQKLGAGRYIKKPFTLEKIGLAVKEELEE